MGVVQLASLKNTFNFNSGCKSNPFGNKKGSPVESCGGFMEGNALNPRCSCGEGACHWGQGGWACRCGGRAPAPPAPHLPPQIAIGRPFVGTNSGMTAAAAVEGLSDWIGLNM